LIQGCAADITKIAMILVRNYIKKNNLWNSIKIVCQVHDQIDTVCIAEMANEWKIKLDELMVEAGKVIIPSGILRSDVNLSPFWTK
jgi:DNA polymerase I-like protein with 3'-5' exonuclease and polymerase domains